MILHTATCVLLAVLMGLAAYTVWLQRKLAEQQIVLQNILIPWLNGISQHIGDDRPPIPAPPIKG